MGSNKITVFFTDNRAVTFDRDKVAFCDGGNLFFDFSEIEKPEEEKKYSSLVKNGNALVNWNNVCYVKELAEKNDPYDD